MIDYQSKLEIARIDMAYDASGQRVQKTEYRYNPTALSVVEQVKTSYVDNSVVFTKTPLAANDVVEEINITTPNGIEGKVVFSAGGENYRYYLKDHLGSTREVIDGANGTTVSGLMYSSYGEIKEVINSAAEATSSREKFTGKEYDNEGAMDAVTGVHNGSKGLGWSYFGARSYDPVIGMWASTDAARQFWSGYNYGEGNPLVGKDPDGNVWVYQNGDGEYVFTLQPGMVDWKEAANSFIDISVFKIGFKRPSVDFATWSGATFIGVLQAASGRGHFLTTDYERMLPQDLLIYNSGVVDVSKFNVYMDRAAAEVFINSIAAFIGKDIKIFNSLIFEKANFNNDIINKITEGRGITKPKVPIKGTATSAWDAYISKESQDEIKECMKPFLGMEVHHEK